MQTVICNLFAGPGSGKSTMMAAVFSTLKFRGVNCEMVTEYAKEKVWEESFSVLNDQVYVFAKQLHDIRVLIGKVQVIITDSPLMLSLYYGSKESELFRKLVVEQHHNALPSLNFFLIREKEYEPSGRMQTEDVAKFIDEEIKNILASNYVQFEVLPSNTETAAIIVERILTRIKEGCPTCP